MKRKHIGKLFDRILVRTACTAVLLSFFLTARVVHAQDSLQVVNSDGPDRGAGVEPVQNCRIIFLGFVGALEPAGNKYSGVVQIRKTLQGKEYSDVCANSFSPYVWTDGRDWLLKHFPSHSGPLTPEELQRSPKVILIGHSMGGWAMMSVARELRSRDIPVELTIQMDSVGIADYTIPRNVKSCAIFHANDMLMFMTTKHVKREDPNHTNVVADVIVRGAGHQSITRDPRIRELVMATVESLRSSIATHVLPLPHPAAAAANSSEKQ